MSCVNCSGVSPGLFNVTIRRAFIWSGLLLAPFTATAEVVCALGPAVSSYNSNADQRPTGDAMQLVGRVNGAFTSICLPRCPAVALLRNDTAANAMLIVTGSDAKIVYSPKFFSALYNSYGDAAIMAVIAHEYGHAIDETTPSTWLDRKWTPELRADAWAGCALAKVNLNANSLTAALTALSKYPSPAHPGWARRLPALRRGYTHCGGDGSTFDSGATIKR